MTHTNRNQNKVIIMEIKITRQKAIKDLVEGVLSIDGGPAMDTLENRCSCLKVGEYHAVMKKCKLYHEQRILYSKTETEYHAKKVTAKFICDRGVSHEIVRHRGSYGMSFAQESTRYCNYSKSKFGQELTFIEPAWEFLLLIQ